MKHDAFDVLCRNKIDVCPEILKPISMVLALVAGNYQPINGVMTFTPKNPGDATLRLTSIDVRRCGARHTILVQISEAGAMDKCRVTMYYCVNNLDNEKWFSTIKDVSAIQPIHISFVTSVYNKRICRILRTNRFREEDKRLYVDALIKEVDRRLAEHIFKGDTKNMHVWKCIAARQLRLIREPKKKNIVPYNDPDLRLLASSFTGMCNNLIRQENAYWLWKMTRDKKGHLYLNCNEKPRWACVQKPIASLSTKRMYWGIAYETMNKCSEKFLVVDSRSFMCVGDFAHKKHKEVNHLAEYYDEHGRHYIEAELFHMIAHRI